MSTAIIILILLVICFCAVKSYMKKLASGCCGAGGDAVKKITVSDTDESHYPYKLTIIVKGMKCKKCEEHIENKLNAEDGVWAKADAKSGTVIVRMKKEVPDIRLKQLIMAAGYEA